MSTYMAKPDEVDQDWYVVDAEGKTLGRMASEIASILKGKHKPEYTPHVDTGDYVIVVNAEKVEMSGDKWEKKRHIRHSHFPGGMKKIPYEELRESNPELIIEEAVRGMMPSNTLGRKMLKKLKVYAGPEHPHEAQKPEKLELE